MVKIVTDSCSDITPELAQEFGISVVPLYVQFGKEIYRDNVDLSTEEFYQKLEKSKIAPTTSTPGPDVFAEFFTRLAEETDEIVAIMLSQMLSGVYAAALKGKTMVTRDCRIAIIDSTLAISAQMLLVISAARMARSGDGLDQIVDWVRKAIPRIHIQMTFDTLEYLRKGGRIGKAQAFLGSLLRVNPILTLKDGLVYPVARVRNRTKAIDYLVDFVRSLSRIEAIAVEDVTTPEDLEILADRLKGLVSPENFYRSKVDPVVGVHVGPRVLAACVLEAE
jgi:DegV family protein with EDD domain